MKLKNINWGIIAVLLYCLLFWVWFIASVVSLAGCSVPPWDEADLQRMEDTTCVPIVLIKK